MPKTKKVLLLWAFGLFVAAALGVGVQRAYADPVSASCPDDGYTRLGSCASQAECQAKCDDVHGVGQSVGVCSGGCCHCLI
jgi:hypothetical protein